MPFLCNSSKSLVFHIGCKSIIFTHTKITLKLRHIYNLQLNLLWKYDLRGAYKTVAKDCQRCKIKEGFGGSVLQSTGDGGKAVGAARPHSPQDQVRLSHLTSTLPSPSSPSLQPGDARGERRGRGIEREGRRGPTPISPPPNSLPSSRTQFLIFSFSE